MSSPALARLPEPDRPQAVECEVTWPPRVQVDAEMTGPGYPQAVDVFVLDEETGLWVLDAHQAA